MGLFQFEGTIPDSKSHFNRAMICASYGQEVKLRGHSDCDDVKRMREALEVLRSDQAHEYDCGAAGTVLRFLAFRVSRLPGRHILKGTPRLLSRPQDELRSVLAQLGVQIEIEPNRLIITSSGWRLSDKPILVGRQLSSQFVSGLLLNAWELEKPLKIEWTGDVVSEGYWRITREIVKDFGMEVEEVRSGIFVPARAQVKIEEYEIESDLSSTFAIAAYAALNGRATFFHFPFQSSQPDRAFVSLLEKMGVRIDRQVDRLTVTQTQPHNPILKGIHANINDCPDLFPVLSALCAFAEGASRLEGAPHLAFKESNRIAKSAELLDRMGVKTEVLADGMAIHPPTRPLSPTIPFDFDTDHDHRLAFAAALVRSRGVPVEILNPQVVNKSFPEFWKLLTDNSKDSW